MRMTSEAVVSHRSSFNYFLVSNDMRPPDSFGEFMIVL